MESDRVLQPIPLNALQTGNTAARRQTTAPTGDQALAWQRELAQAQADGFAWFSPVAAPARPPVAQPSRDVTDTGTPVMHASSAKYTESSGNQPGAPIEESERDIRPGPASADAFDHGDHPAPWLDAAAPLPATGSVPMPLVAWLPTSSNAPVAVSNVGTPSTPSSLQAWLATSLGTNVARVGSPSDALRALPDEDGAEPEPEPLQSPELQHGIPKSPDPMRVYAEWSEDGVRVWLGADTERLADVTRVARVLRDQLRQQGVRLQAVVCNGTDISLYDGTAAEATAGIFPSTDSPRF